jgi:drug/metabolite transporter, DME family
VMGICLAIVGIAVIVLFRDASRPGEGRGIAFGLASGIGYAAAAIGMRGMRDVDPIWLSIVNNLGGALALGAFAWIVWGPIAIPSGKEMLILLAFGVFQMAIPYALFARALQSVPAPEATLITLLEPLLNPIWVYLVHHERPGSATLAGGSLILLGVAARYLPWKAVDVTATG